MSSHHDGFLRPSFLSARIINTNNTNSKAPLILSSRSTDERPMLSKSLGGDFSPLRSMLTRHVSSDLSTITYSGYLLKRSNQPYHYNQNQLFSQDYYVAREDEANRLSPQLQILDASTMLDAPDLPMLNPMGSTPPTLRPKSDVPQQPLGQQGHLIPPRHPANPNASPWNDMDDGEPSSSTTSSDWNGTDMGGPIQQEATPLNLSTQKRQTQQRQQQEEWQVVDPTPTKTPIEQGIEICAAFFGIKLGDDTSSSKKPNDATHPRPNQRQLQHHQPGIDPLSPLGSTRSSTNELLPTQVEPPVVIRRSRPIKMNSSVSSFEASPAGAAATETTDAVANRDSFQEAAYHRRSSAPLVADPACYVAPPSDVIDPIDGHLWRAKYCVLEGGILYFYRNPTDAECPDAVLERRSNCEDFSSSGDSGNNNKYSTTIAAGNDNDCAVGNNLLSQPPNSTGMANSSVARTSTAADLSKSPMPRRRTVGAEMKALSSSSETLNSSEINSGAVWEKRVFLNCVGAVRSAEMEYGKNSFELVAINDDLNNSNGHDDDEEDSTSSLDKLVLRAQNPEEMNEWLFQFHRSLASFLFNLVDVLGEAKSNGSRYLDIHHPVFCHRPLNDSSVETSLDRHRHRMASYSPRFRQQAGGSVGGHSLPHAASLSHGHGRNALHRRRGFGACDNIIGGSYHSQGNGMPRQKSSNASLSEHETSSLSSTPETASGSYGGGLSSQLPFALRESPVAIPPRSTGSPEQAFLLPPSQPQQQQQPSTPARPKDLAPEYSAPQSQYPETERPLPKKTTGKYIPPHMRARQQEQQNNSIPPAKKKYIPPHLRKKQTEEQDGKSGSKEENITKRYVPPSLRNSTRGGEKTNQPASTSGNGSSPGNATSLLSLSERAAHAPDPAPPEDTNNNVDNAKAGSWDVVGRQSTPFTRGGCADPDVVHGSILDAKFIPKKASKVGKVATEAFGCYGGGKTTGNGERIGRDHVGTNVNSEQNGGRENGMPSTLRYEVGAVSECGIRNSNEDAFLIACDLIDAFQSLPRDSLYGEEEQLGPSTWVESHGDDDHDLGLFAVFDGHCGDQAARFAAEKLAHFIHEESKRPGGMAFAAVEDFGRPLEPSNIEHILGRAVSKLDDAFCRLCVKEGREWESGATALVAMLVKEHLVIGNLGDCRGVLCRFVENGTGDNDKNHEDWSELAVLLDESGGHKSPTNKDDTKLNTVGRCLWKEVTKIHSPGQVEERARIEQANGWVTTETEIPIGQLRRMDLMDEDVIDILKRCFYDRCGDVMMAPSASNPPVSRSAAPQRILHISRVCGELSVSRALGDRDFKAAHNTLSATGQMEFDNDMGVVTVDDTNTTAGRYWDSALFLPYPDSHNRRFQGDLVSNIPDFHRVKVGERGVTDEFLLLACDGLWDVMDPDDAVRVTRDLLFRKEWTAKKAAARLAELAIHLGSSDNITVIVVRFFRQAG